MKTRNPIASQLLAGTNQQKVIPNKKRERKRIKVRPADVERDGD